MSRATESPMSIIVSVASERSMPMPHEHQSSGLVALRASQPPARFESWPEDVKERARDLWGTVGAQNAARVEWLLSREVGPDGAVPSASTIRRWAVADDWETWATGELRRTHAKTVSQLRTTWLRLLQLSQETQMDILVGRYDEEPAAGMLRSKTAETVQRTLLQGGLLAQLPAPPKPEGEDDDRVLTEAEKQQRALARLKEIG
jgi:hypothetical protein